MAVAGLEAQKELLAFKRAPSAVSVCTTRARCSSVLTEQPPIHFEKGRKFFFKFQTKQQLALFLRGSFDPTPAIWSESKSQPRQNTKNPKDYYKDPNVCVCVGWGGVSVAKLLLSMVTLCVCAAQKRFTSLSQEFLFMPRYSP